MKIQLRLFSVAKDLAGFDDRRIEVESSARADSILAYLGTVNPRFLQWKSAMRIAVNHEYVHHSHSLKEGDEVAVIPPVSGG